MPIFSLSKSLEKHKSMHYCKFIDHLKTQHRLGLSEVRSIKNKDTKEIMELQLKALNTLIFSIESGLRNSPPFCDNSIANILKPIAEHYVKKGQLKEIVLQAF